MLKKSLLVTFVLVLTVALVFAVTEENSKDETVRCPVSGETIKKSEAKASFEYNGETYYFCSDHCQEAFVANPEKYVKKNQSKNDCCADHSQEGKVEKQEANAQTIHAHEGMVVDPVCGMEFKKEKARATHDYKGKTYYFCSESCKDKFVNNPDEYVRADDKIVTCPVSKKSFKKSETTESMDYDGITYYFCCPGCKEKFEREPEKYTKENN